MSKLSGVCLLILSVNASTLGLRSGSFESGGCDVISKIVFDFSLTDDKVEELVNAHVNAALAPFKLAVMPAASQSQAPKVMNKVFSVMNHNLQHFTGIDLRSL